MFLLAASDQSEQLNRTLNILIISNEDKLRLLGKCLRRESADQAVPKHSPLHHTGSGGDVHILII